MLHFTKEQVDTEKLHFWSKIPMQQLEALPGLIRVGKLSKPDIGRLALALICSI